ncbi:MAG: cation:proton antiporter, partial [Victivallaceae bacterium]|nr:cation:proton antiporter [Victivallaceae bacterium]
FMSFLANSAIFLLLGFTEADKLFDFGGGGHLLLAVGVAILAIQAARIVVVFGMSPFLGFGRNRIGLDYQAVMFWGGLRGAVPLALVFSIPDSYVDRTLIMQITLAVVLFTLLVQGLTTERLLKLFGLDRPGTLSRLAEWYTMLKARRAAVETLREAAAEKNFDEAAISRLAEEYGAKLNAVMNSFDFKDAANRAALDRMIWAGMVEVEHAVIGRYLRSGLLHEDGCRRLLAFNGAMADDLDAERTPDAGRDAGRIASTLNFCGWRPLGKAWFRRMFPPRTFELFCRDFAMLMTLLIASRTVRAELDESAARFPGGLADGALSPCRDFLSRRSAELRRRLNELRGFDGNLYLKAQEYVLRCVIFDAELKVIENANTSGALDDAEFDKLSETIGAGKNALINELQA